MEDRLEAKVVGREALHREFIRQDFERMMQSIEQGKLKEAKVHKQAMIRALKQEYGV